MAPNFEIPRRRAWQAWFTFGMAALLIVGLLAGARPVFATEGDVDTAGADILVTIESGVGGNFGDIVQLGISVQNAGPGPAASVTLSVSGDLFEAAVTGLPEGAQCAVADAVSCPLGDLDAGQGLALTIEGMMAFECIGYISASVASATTPDPVPGNNVASREFGQGCTEYNPPADPCMDEYGNWTCSECLAGWVDAGVDQVVAEGDLVTLSGAWDSFAAQWWQAGAPEVVLSDPGAASPTFIAPQVDADTVLTFVLYGDGCAPVEDSVQITVLDSPTIVVCPRPQGFWKNTLEVWPVEALVLGSQVLYESDLRAVLETPVRKDARLILAAQLIAARLSLAAGAPDSGTPEGLASEVADAGSVLLGQAGGSLFAKSGAVSTNSTDGRLMTRLAIVLEAYAKGLLTEGCSG